LGERGLPSLSARLIETKCAALSDDDDYRPTEAMQQPRYQQRQDASGSDLHFTLQILSFVCVAGCDSVHNSHQEVGSLALVMSA
jgi:hypothetical protein